MMRVPMFWTPVKNPGGKMLVALRREWAKSGSVDVVDRSAIDSTNGPWTVDEAQKERVVLTMLQGKDARFSNPKLLDLPAGRFNAVCEEAKYTGNVALTCYIVGTPLQLSYLGDDGGEADAKKMIASLH